MGQSSEPFPLIYCLVGRITIEWAYLEMALDQCVFTIRARTGQTIEKETPRAFDRKRRFVHAAMNKAPEFATFVDDCLPLLERANTLAKERNEKVHGAIFGEEGQKTIVHFVGYDFTHDLPVIRYRETTLLDLDDLAKRIAQLAQEMTQFSSRLASKFGR